MDKPIVFVIGVSNSYTSMVAGFLLSNGAIGGVLSPERDDDYPRYENRNLKRFEDGIEKGIQKYGPLQEEINILRGTHKYGKPDDRTIVLKGSKIGYYLKRFRFWHRVKIVYCMRNPRSTVASNMDKGSSGFIAYFERYCDMYDIMREHASVLPFMAERLRYDYRRLLEFCEIETDEIDFSCIKPFNERQITYGKHRFSNFWWKRLTKIFGG